MCIDDPGERAAGPLREMRVGAHRCAGVWQVTAAETVVSTGRGATQSSPVLCRGTACTAAVADQETARLLPATQRPLLEGRRHRSTGQLASLRRSWRPERHRSSTSRRPRSAALVETLCPYEELQQPASCPCNALNSPALCCLGGPRRHTSTQGTGLWACTHLLLHPVQDSVRHPALLRTATDVYYLSVTPCLYI